jgi:undecaprenyl-diphosphatase
MITYFQAIILGLVQGVTELFPISSLGHAVLVANLFDWKNLLKEETARQSQFLTFLVVIHLATAIALLIFYREQWGRIISGFFRSLRTKKIVSDSDAKLAWLLIAATIPAGLIGFIFQHSLQSHFAKPIFAVILITINGVILLKGDKIVRKGQVHRPRQRQRGAAVAVDELAVSKTSRMVSDHLSFGRAITIGVIQIGALFAGISRSGITMIAGLRSGLNHEDAARFSFLLATPIIFLAGIDKIGEIVGSQGAAIRGQMLIGGIIAGIGAYFSVRYLAGVFMLLLGIYRGHF